MLPRDSSFRQECAPYIVFLSQQTKFTNDKADIHPKLLCCHTARVYVDANMHAYSACRRISPSGIAFPIRLACLPPPSTSGCPVSGSCCPLRSRRKCVYIFREINLSVFFHSIYPSTHFFYVNSPPTCLLYLLFWQRHDLVAGLLGSAEKPLAIFISRLSFFSYLCLVFYTVLFLCGFFSFSFLFCSSFFFAPRGLLVMGSYAIQNAYFKADNSLPSDSGEGDDLDFNINFDAFNKELLELKRDLQKLRLKKA